MLSVIKDLFDISSTEKDLRRFAEVMAGICAVVAIWSLVKHTTAIWPWAIASGTLVAIRFAWPRMLLPFQKVWMGVSVIVGWLVSRTILIIFFYCGVTLIGLLGRIFRKQFLALDLKGPRKTYWIKVGEKTEGTSRFEKQF